jgi:hypothetical protein
MSEPITVWRNISNETRLTLTKDPKGGYLLSSDVRLVSDWESTQCFWFSEEQAIALFGVLATLFPPGPESAEDVPLPLQRLGTAALLIEAVEAGYWASSLGGDIRGESADRRLQQLAGEINRRLYQYLRPSPWVRIGEILYNTDLLPHLDRDSNKKLFDHLSNQAQQIQ